MCAQSAPQVQSCWSPKLPDRKKNIGPNRGRSQCIRGAVVPAAGSLFDRRHAGAGGSFGAAPRRSSPKAQREHVAAVATRTGGRRGAGVSRTPATLCLKGSFDIPEASNKNIAFPCAARVSRFRPSPGCPPLFIRFHGRTGTKTGTTSGVPKTLGRTTVSWPGARGLEGRSDAFRKSRSHNVSANNAGQLGLAIILTCSPVFIRFHCYTGTPYIPAWPSGRGARLPGRVGHGKPKPRGPPGR
jgi:hypothetical protein